MAENIDKRIEQYIQIRDLLKAVDERWNLERKPLLELQDRLAGIIGSSLDESNVTNMKSKAGVCFFTHTSKATLADPEAFMQYVTANGAFHLMDRKANSKAVKDFVEEHNSLPPGCNFTTVRSLNVRRPTGK